MNTLASQTDFRRGLAELFVDVAKVGRERVFGAKDADLRPLYLRDDSAVPFSGYVGERYSPGGLVFLSINPGGGGDAYQQRTEEDERFYPLLHALKASSRSDASSHFERMNRAFIPIVQRWNLWRIVEPTLEAAGCGIEEIAYLDAVPYRTRGDKTPPARAIDAAWQSMTRRIVDALDPRFVVALGKKVQQCVLDRVGSIGVPTICVPRTQGDRFVCDEAKVALERLRREHRPRSS